MFMSYEKVSFHPKLLQHTAGVIFALIIKVILF